jgi:hypothetical protein
LSLRHEADKRMEKSGDLKMKKISKSYLKIMEKGMKNATVSIELNE